MILKIETLNDVGIFNNFQWNNAPSFNVRNIIFGYNGSGKTTLSNVFNLYSSFMEEEERHELYKNLINNENASIKLEFDNGSLEYKDGINKYDICIFNHDFVRNHVYDGSLSKCRGFDNTILTEEQLKNPLIRKLEDEVVILSSRNK